MSNTTDPIRSRFDELDQLIEAADRIVITSHERVDGDGLGSMLALQHHCRERNKKTVCFSFDFSPGNLSFLPGVDAVTGDRLAVEAHEPQLYIFLDVGDIARSHLVEHLKQRKDKGITVVNIDHHPGDYVSADHQALVDVHIVDPKMSATAEIIYHYLNHHQHPISKETATCLLTGILTDTGNFSNKATTDSSMDAAGRLLLHGARLQRITDKIIRNQSVSSLKLWGRALSRLTQDPDTGIASTAITQRDLQECQADMEALDGVANFLNNLKEAAAVAFYRELPDGTIRASLRTTRDDVDVAKIAARYGGGGHAKAAGFSATGKLVQTPHGWRVEKNMLA